MTMSKTCHTCKYVLSEIGNVSRSDNEQLYNNSDNIMNSKRNAIRVIIKRNQSESRKMSLETDIVAEQQ